MVSSVTGEGSRRTSIGKRLGFVRHGGGKLMHGRAVEELEHGRRVPGQAGVPDGRIRASEISRAAETEGGDVRGRLSRICCWRRKWIAITSRDVSIQASRRGA